VALRRLGRSRLHDGEQARGLARAGRPLRGRRAARTRRAAHIRTGTDWTRTHSPPESAPGLGAPLPHICAGTGLTPCPHLRRDWARPAHICAGTGLAPPHICAGHGSPATGWAHPCIRLPLCRYDRERYRRAAPWAQRVRIHIYMPCVRVYIHTNTHTLTDSYTGRAPPAPTRPRRPRATARPPTAATRSAAPRSALPSAPPSALPSAPPSAPPSAVGIRQLRRRHRLPRRASLHASCRRMPRRSPTAEAGGATAAGSDRGSRTGALARHTPTHTPTHTHTHTHTRTHTDIYTHIEYTLHIHREFLTGRRCSPLWTTRSDAAATSAAASVYLWDAIFVQTGWVRR
jgi:hypothetical protein